MQPRWYRGLDEKESAEVKKDFKQAVLLRERLVLILEQEIDKSLKEMRDVAHKGDMYALTEYYVDELAHQRTLADVIKLIKE